MARPGTLARAWAHPFVPAPVLAAIAGLAGLGVAGAAAAPWPALLAWVVLALSAGYAVSGSV